MNKYYINKMDNYINEFFQKNGKGVSNRRIANDCQKLYEKYPNFVLSNDSGKVELTVKDNEENYGFVFNTSYPFQPPQIYYNGKSYIELLKIADNDERRILLKYKKKDCLCCESYNSQSNWCPSVKLTNIIDEIRSVVQLKKAVVHILLADKIKEKYLIDDIDINSYLI